MASRAKVAVTGDRAVDRKLRKLGATEANRVVRRAIRAAMKPVRDAVEAEAPRGETGVLEAAVKLRAIGRSRSRIGVQVAEGNKDFPAKYYAAFVEMGTGHMEAHHAMKRAFDARRAGAKAAALRLIWAGIRAAL